MKRCEAAAGGSGCSRKPLQQQQRLAWIRLLCKHRTLFFEVNMHRCGLMDFRRTSANTDMALDPNQSNWCNWCPQPSCLFPVSQ